MAKLSKAHVRREMEKMYSGQSLVDGRVAWRKSEAWVMDHWAEMYQDARISSGEGAPLTLDELAQYVAAHLVETADGSW